MADELNALELAGKEALEYATEHDRLYDQGGKLAHEELEKQEAQAVAPPPGDPDKTEGTTPLETKPDAPAEGDPWQLLAEGAGKWKDAEEAKKGYFHALNLAKNALAERDRLMAERSQPPSVRPEPAERAEERDALKRIEEFGVPSEVLAEAIDVRAQEVLMKLLQPMANQYQADQYMATKYGDAWAKNKQEVDLYVQSDPEVRALVDAARAQGQIALANEFSLLRYQADRGVKTEEALKANNEVRKELVEAARKDAGIVGARRNEGRDKDSKPEGLTEDRFNQLVARAKAGYEAPLWRETIGKGLPKELFETS